MAPPTRAEINADVTLPTFDVWVKVAGVWTSIKTLIAAATARVEAGGGAASGVAMGPAVSPSASLTLDRSARSYEADRLPVKIDFGFASSDKLTRFNGVLMRARGAGRSATRQWELRGLDAHIEGCEVRTHLLHRRPIFTQTTLTSIEDPDNSACVTGLGNQVLWRCGLRPAEQAASYPSAVGYYRASQALIAPEWTWAPGENPWELLRKLCQAAGGQVYVDSDGTVVYVDPITLATGAVAFTFSDEVLTAAQRVSQAKAGYEDIAEEKDSRRAITGAVCNYVSRIVMGSQEVYAQTIPILLAATGDVNGDDVATVICDTTLPVVKVQGAAIDAATIRTARLASASQVTVSYDHSAAQRTSVTITNTLSEPVIVYALRLTGRPLSAGEAGSARYLSATGRIVSVDDSPFVQDQRHAEMLARMLFDAEATSGTTYTLTGCAYDPDRSVGEVVGLTSSDYSLAALRCRIVRIEVRNGAWMDVALAPLGSLPTRDTVHLVGSVSGTKAMAY